MRVMDETMRPMYEDIMRGIRGGSCLLRRKMSFDSDISQLLLENANEKELGEYVAHMTSLTTYAQSESETLRLSGKKKTCGYENCREFVRDKLDSCILHATKTLIAFDFNNLQIELRALKY